MALPTKFVGVSSSGDPKEAIRDALKKARRFYQVEMQWQVLRIAENKLTFPPLLVLIRVYREKMDGIGPG